MSEQELNSSEIIRQGLSMQDEYMERKPEIKHPLIDKILFSKPLKPNSSEFNSKVLEFYKNVDVTITEQPATNKLRFLVNFLYHSFQNTLVYQITVQNGINVLDGNCPTERGVWNKHIQLGPMKTAPLLNKYY